MTQVRLDPMTDEEYHAEFPRMVTQYAEEKVAIGDWPAEGAAERSHLDTNELLAEGPSTAGHRLYIVRDGDRRVGFLWWAEQAQDTGRIAYLYSIYVDPEQRGKGYSKTILHTLEDEVRKAGLHTLQLHVFGNNEVARSLYTKVDYSETHVIMVKRLD